MAEYISIDMPIKVKTSIGNERVTTLRELAELNHIKLEVADVRPVVLCKDCKYNNACLTQSIVEDASIIPFDRNTFFCADGWRKADV